MRVRRSIVAVAAVVLASACAGPLGRPGEPEHDEPEKAASAVEGWRVTLTPDLVARAGIRTTRAKRDTVADEIEAYGRVLDPLPLIDAVAARTAARSATAVARAEYTRVEHLHQADQNASTRDLDAARAALDRATVDLAGADARATRAWGGAVDDDPARLADLAAGHAAIVRIDLPPGLHLAGMPATAVVAPVASPERALDARMLTTARDADPVLQSEAYLAVLGAGAPPAGTALVVRLARSPDVRRGAAVPFAAVVWAEGRPSVFVEARPDTFERRDVTIVRMRRGAWLATGGVAPGERVVAHGASRLLSTEVLGAHPAEED
jgi:hypothetical protein